MVSGRNWLGQHPCGRQAQRGAFAIMFVPLLVLIVAFGGLALDMGMVYNRKVELSGMAKAVALAAARELNGKSDGIANARTKARETAQRFSYGYGESIGWTDAALSFGTTSARSGAWVGSESVGDPSGYFYVKVDTSALGVATARVTTIFARILSNSLDTIELAETAIAGRTGISAMPLAICAMSDTPASERSNPGLGNNELVEYGFRRGVSYDLMQLNPRGLTPARYMVNPVIAPGMSSTSFNPAIMGPFVCTGNLWMPRLTGGPIRVSALPASAPLGALYIQLNARFDDFSQNLCFPGGAAPDTNILPYAYDTAGGVPWMSQATGSPAALGTSERGRLETVADIPAPGSTRTGLNGGSYGPLWSFARAAKFSAYTPGVSEPANGYATFTTADWPKLSRAGVTAGTYPWSGQSSPYNPQGIVSPNTIASPDSLRRNFATQFRRVLYVPLLSCAGAAPAGANAPATVVGVGKFFMTVRATSNTLIAEFAGTASERSLPGVVELYP